MKLERYTQNEIRLVSQNSLEAELLRSWNEMKPKIVGMTQTKGYHPKYGPSDDKFTLMIQFEREKKE